MDFDIDVEYALDGQTMCSIARVMDELYSRGDDKARDLANRLFANLNHAVPLAKELK